MYDQQSQLESLERKPAHRCGGAGILYIAFGAVLLLVAAALLVSLWVSVQRRRGEFAVLRAMGLSRGQVVQLLAFEYAIVAILGLVAGAYLGRLVGERMLSFLNVDDAGNRAEPGFLLETDWLLVIAGGAIVLAVFIAAMVFAGRLITRTSDAAALRTE
jgi:putative ABC transport system permease protein